VPRGVGREELRKVSSNSKWAIAAVCGVLGIIGIIYAVIYLAVPIHSLPSIVPGKTNTTGHYHKRAFAAAVIGIVLLAIAAYLGVTARRAAVSEGGGSAGGAGTQPAAGAASTEDAGGQA
jgi:hypothetical protein